MLCHLPVVKSSAYHRDCVAVRVLALLVLLVADAECSSADVASRVRMVPGHWRVTDQSQSCHRSLATDAESSSADVASRRWGHCHRLASSLCSGQ